MICCPEGLQALARSFPEIKIVTAQVDPCLNAERYIVPGLGDYGDRYFGTND
jgi:uracil phosphoribosyltransferase